MKKWLLILLIGALTGALVWRGFLAKAPELKDPENVGQKEEDKSSIEYQIEEFASGLNTPWSIAFTSENRLLVTERPGHLRVIENGVLKQEPLHVFAEVSSVGEEGLMSIALDPDYDKNHYVYISLAYEKQGGMKVKVVRFRDEENQLSEEKIILDGIPAAEFHAGCRLAFGPDGKLYISTGDATERALAQDLNSLAGKILRIKQDGSIPEDNPFQGSPIWSYGHRNPQGLAWHPETGELYATEHGPSVFDGPPGGDEVNRIIAGGNYGWPLVSHQKTKEGTLAPLRVFTPAEAPASAMIYSGKIFPQFKHNLFFGALKGEGLMRIIFSENDPDKIISAQKLPEVRYGRIREVVEGQDGFIYFSTSNRDGRGKPAQTDDRIFRIRPIINIAQ